MANVGQRIKAAQVQAGITSVDDLADKPGRPDRFGSKTIGRVIRGQRDLQPHEAEWLARTLGVEPGYFTAEDAPAENQFDRIERRLERLETLVDRAFHHRSEQGGQIIARLEKLEQVITSAITRTAVEEVSLIVDGIVEKYRRGDLPAVPTPTPRPTDADSAPTSTRRA